MNTQVAYDQFFTHTLLEKAKPIRLVFFDVDGVMTNGSLLYASNGEQLKVFNTLDGMGIQMLLQSGVIPVVISGRNSEALTVRLKELGISHYFLGVDDKLACAHLVLERLGVAWSSTAVMGDDFPDLPLFEKAALCVAPPNAHPEVLVRSDAITPWMAGSGAVRCLCDLITKANGFYVKKILQYVS